MTFWEAKLFAKPLRVPGNLSFNIRSLAVVDHVMEPSRRLDGLQGFELLLPCRTVTLEVG
jgi:hypothetical protein